MIANIFLAVLFAAPERGESAALSSPSHVFTGELRATARGKSLRAHRHEVVTKVHNSR